MGWLGTLWNMATQHPYLFPVVPDGDVHPLDPNTSIAIVGDWGTGDVSKAISAQYPEEEPDVHDRSGRRVLLGEAR